MLTKVVFGAVLALSSIGLAAGWDGVFIDGRTCEGKCFYKVGEKITFSLKIGGVKEIPPGDWTFRWRRTGDDVKVEEGTAPLPFKDAFVYSTSIAKPGFVRLFAEIVGAGPNAKFDGGAGADFERIVQEQGEPADFDAFWKRELDALAQVPFDPQLEEVASPRPEVKLCRFRLGCTHGKPSTGFISVPRAPGKYPVRLYFFGYNESWSPRATAFPTARQAPTNEVVLRVNAHGLENGRDAAYYAAARKAAGSNGFGHGFDPAQNAKPDTCYYLGMILRDVRAAQWAKTLPEWNRRKMLVYGGSQGGAQSLWVTALEPAVTDAEVFIPWMCDWRGRAFGGRLGTDWGSEYAPGLDYYDCVNFAKRIRPGAYVNIFHAGLGDYICPPSGVTSLYHALTCRKRIHWVQNCEHGWSSPAKGKQFADFSSPPTAASLDRMGNPQVLPPSPDDTAALQSKLDQGGEVVLTARTYRISRTLRLRSGTHLRLAEGARVVLAPNSDCMLAANADPAGGDCDISIEGGVWDMDNVRQAPNPSWQHCCNPPWPRAKLPAKYDPSFYRGVALYFENVSNLVVKGVTLRNPVTYALQLCRVRHFSVDGVTLDYTTENPIKGNMDGVHLDGGCHHGRIAHVRGTCWDDMVALNANDTFCAAYQEAISDIEIDGVESDYSHSAVRLLSAPDPVERIRIRNVRGRFFQYAIGFTHYFPNKPRGTIRDVTVENVCVGQAPQPPDMWPMGRAPVLFFNEGTKVDGLKIEGLEILPRLASVPDRWKLKPGQVPRTLPTVAK